MISKSLSDNYSTEISNGVYKLYADSLGDGSQSLHPHDFLEAALSACMNITTRMVLDRMSLKYEGVEVKITLTRPDKENTIITYDIDIQGDIDDATKKLIIDKVYNCPVRKTLTSHIEVVKAQD